MKSHDDASNPAPDEEQIAAQFASINADTPPVDPEALSRLRAQSAFAFSSQSTREGKRIMRFPKLRWLGSAAAVVAIAVGLYCWLAPGKSGVALGNVLDSVEKADTLHVSLNVGWEWLDYWHTRQPNRSRWEKSPWSYTVADGSAFWTVNESSNLARRGRLAPEHQSPTAQILNLLDLPGGDASLLAGRAMEQKSEGDTELLVYRWEPNQAKESSPPVRIEIRRNAKTRQLTSIQSRVDRPNAITRLLTFLAFNEPIGQEKFVVADTLTEDGRIGKVADVQGIVTIKPVLHERWSPVRQHFVLKPGDLIRTDARGANATALRLVKQTGVILGPKTLVELIGPRQIRLIEGEIEVTPTAGATIELFNPEKLAGARLR